MQLKQLALAASLVLALSATGHTQGAGAPRLEVSDPHFSFGYAPQGASISHVFWLKNAGTDTLQITDVRPGCGCTKAPLKKHALGAGDSTDVEVIFSTGHYTSQVNKNASIVCNDPGAPQSLTISAFPTQHSDSTTPLVIDPPMLSMDSLRPESQKTPWQYEITVKNVSDEALSLSLVYAPEGDFTVQLPSEIPAHGEKSLTIKVEQGVTDQIVAKSFTLEASDAARTRYTVPVSKAMRWGPASMSIN